MTTDARHLPAELHGETLCSDKALYLRSIYAELQPKEDGESGWSHGKRLPDYLLFSSNSSRCSSHSPADLFHPPAADAAIICHHHRQCVQTVKQVT